MPGQASHKGAQKMLDAIFNGGTVYVGLSTTAITDTTTLAQVTEPTDATYARKVADFTNAALVNGEMEVSNATKIDYGTWTGNASAPIIYAFLTTAQTGTVGDIDFWWQLDTAQTPTAGQPVSFPIGLLKSGQD